MSNKSNRNNRKSASTAKGATAPKSETPKVVAPAAAAAPAGTGTVTTKPVQVVPGLKIEKDRPEQNGIKRPSAGGRCRAVWDACDAFAVENGDDPTAKDVREMAAKHGWNANNASIEFYQWRKFNGITGRKAKPAAAPTEPAKA